ncbi:GDSL-type esterase/lipase family protein [Salisediminibacterium halotolerans]|uniref:Lysophospholipase L1 n=1 Tax=Salisediminibacterium halotolerans TaxID=517425 RepID=A0A1H9UZM0_9BACI|nr:GDSL-type esterase/lipase family protein [Salisediminibacterium haloalkalitolerans]SES14970.1 Lysophospholipase L1 [Salisediminibacterium haloalkalitolerans]
MKRIWVNGLLAVSVAGLVMFAGSFVYALADEALAGNNPSAQERVGGALPERQFAMQPMAAGDNDSDADAETEDGKVQLLGLGDSLTSGMGSSDGEGYLRYVEESFPDDNDLELSVTNAAVDGHRTEDVLHDIEQADLNGQVRTADVIVMTIGGNDLFQGGQSLLNDDPELNEDALDEFLLQLDDLYDELTELSPEARVYHIGIYNPFRDFGLSAADDQFVREWNYATLESAASYEQVTYVPVEDMFEEDVGAYLSGDFFHLNDDGYQRVADRLMTALRWPEEEETS